MAARPDSGSQHRRRYEKGRRRVVDAEGVPANEPGHAPRDSEEFHDIHLPLSTASGAQVQLGRVKLVVEQGRQLGEQFLISEAHLLVGRYDPEAGICPDIDLSAQDPAFVHRRHARICWEAGAGALVLVDLGGRNGSFINNRQVPPHSSAPIRIGDKIRIGRVVLRLCDAPEMEGGRGA